MLARHLHTPVPHIEEMDRDRFDAYAAAMNDILRAENPKG